MAAELVHQVNFAAFNPQKLFVKSQSKYTLLSGGYGAGKTHALAMRMVIRCYQNRGLTGMVVASDFTRLNRDILPAFFRLLTQFGIPPPRFEQEESAIPGTPSRFMLIDPDRPADNYEGLKSKVYVASMVKPEAIKGHNLAWIALEEAQLFQRFLLHKQELVWTVMTSRLRQARPIGDPGPPATLTIDASGTPEGKSSWTCDPGMFETAPDEPERFALWSQQFRVIRASSYDNTFNPPNFVADMIASMDPDQVAEKVEGIPKAGVGGAAYPYYDRDNNVTDLEYDPGRGGLIVGLDFNVDPMAAILCQFWRGELFVFDEIWLPDSNTPAMARRIVQRARDLGIIDLELFVEVFPDASGRARKTSGESDFQCLRAEGLTNLRYPPEGNPRVSFRLNCVNGALYHRKLWIAKRCKHLQADMQQVARDKYGDLIKTGDLTHVSDALGYVVTRLIPIYNPGIGIARG